MNIKRLFRNAIPLLLTTPLLAIACYGNTDIKQNDTFTCSTDSDCIPGYTCSNNFCKEQQVKSSQNLCNDADGDGYGTGSDVERSSCRECDSQNAQDWKKGAGVGKPDSENPYCKADCDDTNSKMNPGAVELCDGVDNDCDGNTDNLTHACRINADCTKGHELADGLTLTATCEGSPQEKIKSRGRCQYSVNNSACPAGKMIKCESGKITGCES